MFATGYNCFTWRNGKIKLSLGAKNSKSSIVEILDLLFSFITIKNLYIYSSIIAEF